MRTMQAQFPRAVKAAPEPLEWYLRPPFVNHRRIADAVAGRTVGLHGIVCDPAYEDRALRVAPPDRRTKPGGETGPADAGTGDTGGFNRRMGELPRRRVARG